MAAGKKNLGHALINDCTDPDCEIHNPDVIEDPNQRLTAMAWFYAGVCAAKDADRENIRDEFLREVVK